jgi:hypothetical protein
MTRKPVYQRPIAGDLSGINAIGGKVKPLAMCANGYSVSRETCSNGSHPVTSHPSTACSPNGLGPEYARCASGTVATQGCSTGSTD